MLNKFYPYQTLLYSSTSLHRLSIRSAVPIFVYADVAAVAVRLSNATRNLLTVLYDT